MATARKRVPLDGDERDDCASTGTMTGYYRAVRTSGERNVRFESSTGTLSPVLRNA